MSEDVTPSGEEEVSEREQAKQAVQQATDYRYTRASLSASSGDPTAAVSYVRDYDVGTRLPGRDAVLDLVESLDDDVPVERFDVLNPDHESVDESEPTGSVTVWTDRPGVMATASVEADGTVANERFEAPVSRLRVAETAGLETHSLDRRSVDGEVDPAAVPSTFGDDPESTTVRTSVYSHDGEDVLVSGDPGAVDDLDPADSLVVYAGALDPDAVDVEAVDADVTVVGPADLDPETSVAEQLGQRIDLGRIVDRFDPDGETVTDDGPGWDTGL